MNENFVTVHPESTPLSRENRTSVFSCQVTVKESFLSIVMKYSQDLRKVF